MNTNLQEFFTKHYHKDSVWPLPERYLSRGPNLINLLLRHNIKSMFDAGCGIRRWISTVDFAKHGITYKGGEIVADNVDYCNEKWPELDICVHDMTNDEFPDVDLIFSNDVVIHLNNADKLKFLNNFLSSNATYLLVTHSGDAPYCTTENIDITYTEEFPFQPVNWYLDPWNFPKEIDHLLDIGDSDFEKRMCLWAKDQIRSVLS